MDSLDFSTCRCPWWTQAKLDLRCNAGSVHMPYGSNIHMHSQMQLARGPPSTKAFKIVTRQALKNVFLLSMKELFLLQSRNPLNFYQSCIAVRSGKKSSNQETGLGNMGHLKVRNDTKLVLNEHELSLNCLGSIW